MDNDLLLFAVRVGYKLTWPPDDEALVTIARAFMAKKSVKDTADAINRRHDRPHSEAEAVAAHVGWFA